MASNAHIGRFSKAVFSSRSIVKHGNRSFETEVLYQDPDSSITRNHAYFLLQRCEENNDLEYGRQLRSLLFLNGLDSVAVLEDHLIRLFAYHESLPEANEAFGQVSKPTPFTWTAIIMANAKLGQGKAALELYHQMQASGGTGNIHIYVAVLKACTITSSSEGRIIHDQIIKSSLQSDVVMGNTLIDMYAKCGNLAEASATLKKLPLRDVVSWNTMIAGYAQQGELSVALECFKSMRQEGLRPNVISWGAIINGYAQCGEGVLALKCFIDMQQECIRPDLITFLGALKACASVQAVVQGIVIHSHIMRGGYQFNVVLGTSLIDMYAKCGRLKDALQVFNMLPDPNVVSWGAVIAGYAQHGDYVLALHYFEIMQQEGVRPNVVLWNLIIAGCAHYGEHDLALLCFQKMLHEGIKPNRATFAGALKACACTGAMNQGRLFHGQIIIFRICATW